MGTELLKTHVGLSAEEKVVCGNRIIAAGSQRKFGVGELVAFLGPHWSGMPLPGLGVCGSH